MKVAFFIGGLNIGGTETMVLDSFRKKSAAPFESILIYRNDGELSEQYRATGVPMFRIKPQGSKLGYICELRRLLKREKVDILHTQTLLNALLGLFCVCFSRVKLVASFHGFRYSRIERFYTHLVLWYADACVFVSGFVKDWYLKNTRFAPEKRCHVVYNGIDFSKFDQDYPLPDFLKSTEVSASGVANFVMVGNFVSGRSQIMMCKAANALVKRGTDRFRLFFVGKRSDIFPKRFDNCVKYCREQGLLDKKVFFLGGRGDVPAILQNVDGFVYSTDHDTFGIAVVEAISVGLPVVVNDWEVMKEITKNGEMAMLYKTRDVADCADKVEYLLNNIEECKQKAKVAAAHVRELYGIERHILNLNSVYESVCQNPLKQKQ